MDNTLVFFPSKKEKLLITVFIMTLLPSIRQATFKKGSAKCEKKEEVYYFLTTSF